MCFQYVALMKLEFYFNIVHFNIEILKIILINVGLQSSQIFNAILKLSQLFFEIEFSFI